jgi:hypothetical protein
MLCCPRASATLGRRGTRHSPPGRSPGSRTCLPPCQPISVSAGVAVYETVHASYLAGECSRWPGHPAGGGDEVGRYTRPAAGGGTSVAVPRITGWPIVNWQCRKGSKTDGQLTGSRGIPSSNATQGRASCRHCLVLYLNQCCALFRIDVFWAVVDPPHHWGLCCSSRRQHRTSIDHTGTRRHHAMCHQMCLG